MRALLRLLLALGLTLAGRAAAAPQIPSGTEFQLFIENDMLARTDRYYTNGIKFGGGLPFDVIQLPAKEVLQQLAPEEDSAIHLGMFFGQNLYTPRSIGIREAQLNDRPWAAWLYLGGVAQRARGHRLDTVELDVGMVGPVALGKEVQSNWHHLVGSPQPMGWENQIPNEPAFMLSYLGKRRYASGKLELIPHAG